MQSNPMARRVAMAMRAQPATHVKWALASQDLR